jgi:hypothetical protein
MYPPRLPASKSFYLCYLREVDVCNNVIQKGLGANSCKEKGYVVGLNDLAPLERGQIDTVFIIPELMKLIRNGYLVYYRTDKPVQGLTGF